MHLIRIMLILLAGLFFAGCHKENGKYEYEMKLLFDNGDVLTDSGKIFEKFRKSKKYKEQIHDAFNIKASQGKALYIEVFSGYIFLKVNDNKFVCSDQIFAGAGPGETGDIYFEGNYTQKGRAYTVENGYFEVIYRDQFGTAVSDVMKGKWTLKRKYD